MQPSNTDEHDEYNGAPPKWPVIWGAISIVFGVLGFLLSIFGVIQMVFIENTMNSSAEDMRTAIPGTDPEMTKIREDAVESQMAMMESMKEDAPLSIGISIASAVIAIVLIVGGVLLCKRRRVAVRVLQVWATLRVLVGGLGIFVQYEMTSKMMQSTTEAFESAGAGSSGGMQMGSMMNIIAMVSTVFGFLWMLWLPLFFFIWFNKENVKENIKTGAGWR